jgi:phosphoesterase RecJ-like protein
MNATLEDVCDALRSGTNLCLLTHEHPDGDAIGSLVGLHRVLLSVGIDSSVYIDPDDMPAAEYEFLVPEARLLTAVPEDLSDVTLVVLDSGNLERSAVGEAGLGAKAIINIDHHHDNTRYGSLNHVDAEASCTAEIVWELSKNLEASLDDLAIRALYIGLVTDTGRFMYSNTGAKAHEMAADLIAQGLKPAPMFRRIYEGVPQGRSALLGRALSKLQRHAGGAVSLVFLTRSDFDECEALDGWSEGVIDHLRAIQGTKVAAVIREPSGNPDNRRISLRAATDEVDVSAIARAGGGGGHPGAAGFSSDLAPDALVNFIVESATAAGAV